MTRVKTETENGIKYGARLDMVSRVKYRLHCHRKIILKSWVSHSTHKTQRHSDCAMAASSLLQISSWFPVVAIFIPFFYA